MNGNMKSRDSGGIEVEDPELLEQARKVLSQPEKDDLSSESTAQVSTSSLDEIQSLSGLPYPNLAATTFCDIVVVSDSNALSPDSRWSPDLPTKTDISTVASLFPDARWLLFNIKPLVNNSRNMTISSEADRLFTKLRHLKALDLTGRGSRPLEDLLPSRYRTIFIAKGVGTSLVKECLMASRISNTVLSSMLWESCRGIICVNPIDGQYIAQLRRDNIPTTFLQKLRASWWTSWLSSTRKRIAKLSDIVDEGEQIELDYADIVEDAPPRFSVVKTDPKVTSRRSPVKWKEFNDLVDSKDLKFSLEEWKSAPQTAPASWPATLPTGTRLLSVDGGGVKGISSLMVFDAIMKKVQELESAGGERLAAVEPGTNRCPSAIHEGEPFTDLLPVKYFDLAGGTSTGGLVAVFLFRLRMCIPCTIAAYNNMAPEIFAPKLWGFNVQKIPLIGYGFGSLVLKTKVAFNQPQFEGEALEKVVDKVLEKNISHEWEELQTNSRQVNGPQSPELRPRHIGLLEDESSRQSRGHGKMFLCATRVDRSEAVLFRNYKPTMGNVSAKDQARPKTSNGEDKNPEYKWPPLDAGFENITIGDACRATSSAPTYFEPKIVNNVRFWDGGLLNNNPIDQVWDSRYDAGDGPVSCVVSFGATYPSKPKQALFGFFPLLNIITQAASFITNTEAKHKDFERMVQRENLRLKQDEKIQYFRFNVPTGSESVGLDDWKKMGDLRKYTNQYLETRDAQDEILRCAHALVRVTRKTLAHVVHQKMGTQVPAERQLPKSTGPSKEKPQQLRQMAFASATSQLEGPQRFQSPSVTARVPATAGAVIYRIRVHSEKHRKCIQTKPFVDTNSDYNVISTTFAMQLGLPQDDFSPVEGDKIDSSRSVQLKVDVYRQGEKEADTRELTFHIVETPADTAGNVFLGKDVLRIHGDSGDNCELDHESSPESS